MRTIHILGILVLLALAVPAAPAHAGGIVNVCDEVHLRAALAGGGTVTFSCSGTITLTNTITIATDTTIDASGQTITISGNNAVRGFYVRSGATLNLNRLTIANGSGGGWYGGGILSDGTLNVNNTIFSGNSAGEGGGIANWHGMLLTVSNCTFSDNSATYGGGIYSDNSNSSLIVSNSTFLDNSATGGGMSAGGGMYSLNGTVTVSNSTFLDNNATSAGGGIVNDGYPYLAKLTVSNSTFFGNNAIWGGSINNVGTITVTNSTFSGNSASDGGAIYNYHDSAIATVSNSIVANSSAGGNCSGAITDGGGNLSYPDMTCPGINADPLLGPLQNNGGPTFTMALGPGSAAIDAGDDAICAAPPVNNLDQRGVTRPLGSHCDIGAVEQQPYKKTWLPTVRSR